MSDLDSLRGKLSELYMSTKDGTGAHTVSFQPLRTRKNEDRLASVSWDIAGQRWVFLAVCDGHTGPSTAEYTAARLPEFIREGLVEVLRDSLDQRLDRENITAAESVISAMLVRVVEDFDAHIGHELKRVCPRPGKLSEARIQALIEDHRDIVMRAWNGTTLSAALVNVTNGFVWGIGVGDSTAMLCVKDVNGVRRSQKLCKRHTLKDPQEYFRASLAGNHCGERVVVNDRILSWQAVPRTIGDFVLKFHPLYLKRVFRHLPYNGYTPLDIVQERIKTPPYIIATPSVCFTDLHDFRGCEPIIVLFTDGVDDLVDGYFIFRQASHSGLDPCDVVSKLLQAQIDPQLEEALEHGIELGWTGTEGNKAVDILGNLVGGTDVRRLDMVMDQDLLGDKEAVPGFYVDDTTIVVYEFEQ